jgi:hypothetical protein
LQVKFNLSQCGKFLEYQCFIPAWFGSHKHFEKEFRMDQAVGKIWDSSNAENAGLFSVAQEIHVENPDIDADARL